MNYTLTGTNTPLHNVTEAATYYINKGFAVTPLVGKSKKPKLNEWPKKKILLDEVEKLFLQQDNIGIILGEISGWVVDVDFDHPIAKCFASFLPETTMIHGRLGNSISHFWYRVQTPIKSKKYADPEGKVLIELRSDGGVTMAPPSIHPNGDQLEWVNNGDPELVDSSILAAAVAKIASATILAISWPAKGSRNEAALALAGALLRAGWDVLGAASFIRQVAKASGDEEYEARGKCAESTASKVAKGDPVTGLTKLSALVGADIVSRLVEWLCLDSATGCNEKIDAVIEELNQRHAVVSVGGGTWILNEIINAATNSPDISLSRASDFKLKYRNRVIKTWHDESECIADVWLDHPDRREFAGIEFAPESPLPDFYNLFRGFSFEPFEGDCSLYLTHVEIVICKGDKIIYEYVLSWMAHAIQHPGELPGTALVLRGAQGVGKGVFVDNFGKLFGSHFLTLHRLSQITGKFNGHLNKALIVHANEAVWGGHKEAEGALKGLVTDPMMAIEAKGKDIIQIRSFARLICSSNEQWAVPLDLDDRRFLILDVSPAHKEDHDYFYAIVKQMENGGWAALMYCLSTRDISKFNVRKLPATTMAFELKLLSATPVTSWWYEQLLVDHGFCGGVHEKSVVYKSYLDWCQDHKKSYVSTLPVFGKDLLKLVPALKTVKPKATPIIFPMVKEERISCFVFPKREECRKHFETLSKSGPEIWEE